MTTDPTPIYISGDDPAPRLRPLDTIRPVDERDARLAGRLHTLQWRCEEIAHALPVDRVTGEQLLELAGEMAAVATQLAARARASTPRVVDAGDSGGR